MKAQHNSDFVHSEIPFNLSLPALRAAPLPFSRGVFILHGDDDRFLFDPHDQIIPCGRGPEL